jgi:glucose-6-phosphate 1-dehydrogenase
MHSFLEEDTNLNIIEPCIFVVFGATGDLTKKRLLPALYNLGLEGLLPSNFACISFARKEKDNVQFRKEIEEYIKTYNSEKSFDKAFFSKFKERFFYFQSEYTQDEDYDKFNSYLKNLDAQFNTRGNRVFYLATPPKHFPLILEKLSNHSLLKETNKTFSRVIIEKPFGHDFTSAENLQKHIQNFADEDQIFRIDHYLAKEAIQNLLVFRFTNSIFNSIWNNKHINHVQISFAETIGVEGRGMFFEEQGTLRDIVQNHMMQVLSLVAMEPPSSFSAEDIQKEKLKVIQSIKPLTNFDQIAIRGQYDEGYINGKKVSSYQKEENVSLSSNTETFVALKLELNNKRFQNVPFYIRAGKHLPKQSSEIAIIFKDCFTNISSHPNSKNVLVIRIQPDEGIALKVNTKIPGQEMQSQPVKMDFNYGSYFGRKSPDAYQRLIRDCILGDHTLFTTSEEVLASWKLLTPLLDHWKNNKADFPNYSSGTWGPKASDDLMKKDNKQWRVL